MNRQIEKGNIAPATNAPPPPSGYPSPAPQSSHPYSSRASFPSRRPANHSHTRSGAGRQSAHKYVPPPGVSPLHPTAGSHPIPIWLTKTAWTSHAIVARWRPSNHRPKAPHSPEQPGDPHQHQFLNQHQCKWEFSQQPLIKSYDVSLARFWRG